MRLRMIYKVLAGTVGGLAVLAFAALRVHTTGTYAHTFNASPDKVWRVWNDPEAIRKWWGPKDYTAPVIRNDPRAGGRYLWAMESPAGDLVWNTGVYKEVVPNVRLVSTLSFSDETGRAIPGPDVPVPGHWPDEILVSTEFAAVDGKTKVTVTEVGLPLIMKYLSAIAWDQQFDKVASML